MKLQPSQGTVYALAALTLGIVITFAVLVVVAPDAVTPFTKFLGVLLPAVLGYVALDSKVEGVRAPLGQIHAATGAALDDRLASIERAVGDLASTTAAAADASCPVPDEDDDASTAVAA